MTSPFRALACVVLAALLFAGRTSAQVSVVWSTAYSTATYGSSAHGLYVDAQGRTFVAGGSPTSPMLMPKGQNYSRPHLACLGPFGTLLWEQSISPPTSNGYFVDVAVDANGRSVVITATTPPAGPLILSYDNAGVLLWQWTPPFGLDPPALSKVMLDSAGNAYVVGQAVVSNHIHILALKLAPTGALLSTTTWDLAHYVDYLTDAALDAQGNLYVCGQTGITTTSYEFAFVKFDAALNVVWAHTMSVPWMHLYAIACDTAGRTYVAMSAPSAIPTVAAFGVMGFDANGTLAWTDSVADATHAAGQARDIAVDVRGDVLVVGYLEGLTPAESRVRKYDPSGNLLWSRAISGPGHMRAYQVDLDEGGDLLVAATLQQAASNSIFSFRYDRDGHLAWTHVGATGVNGPGVSSFLCDGVHVLRLEPNVVPTCFGDGSGTACPCANASTHGDRSGCTNSLGSAGRLGHDGMATLSNDSLVLIGTGLPDSAALYFQGTLATNGGAGVVFGDGLRCVGGTVVRLATVLNSGNQSQYPNGSASSVSIKGQIGAPGIRYYQVRYRNSAAFCTSDTFNTTNALQVSWLP